MTTQVDSTMAALGNNNNEDLHAMDDDVFESEIARMSQDTDAILDSIRRAAQQTPTVRRKRRNLHILVQQQTSPHQSVHFPEQQHHETTNPTTHFHLDLEPHHDDMDDHDHHHHHHDEDHDDDMDDDDMTDDGSVPEEVRRKIQDELTQLDTKFSNDPDGVSEEIMRVSLESLSPLAAMQADEQVVMMKQQQHGHSNHVEVPFLVGSTVQLAVQAIVVWLLIFAILVRVWHKGMLDENGLFAWPFSFATRTVA